MTTTTSVDDDVRRAALARHIEYTGVDGDVVHELYAEHAVLELPQSGERFEGLTTEPWPAPEWRARWRAAP